MEHRVTITIPAQGRVEEASDQLLTAFEREAPEVGAATGGNFERDTVDATFSFPAIDVTDAAQRGKDTFDRAAAAAGLAPVRIVGLEVELAEELAPEPA